MKDPQRLLDDASLSEVERRSLRAALADAPPPELVREVWTGLGTAVGSGAAGGAVASVGHAAAKGSAASLASTGGKLAVIKALAVGAAVGAVTAGGTVALTTPHRASPAEHVPDAPRPALEPPRGRAVVPRALPAPSVKTETRDTVPVAPVAPTATPPAATDPRAAAGNPPSVAGFEPERGAAPAASATSPETDAARVEARLVGEAREALQRRDAATALAVLAEAARRFPRGILLQEREALTISALADAGRRSEAVARAGAFLREFPESPHAERVRRAVRER
jgi:hypothetical protein